MFQSECVQAASLGLLTVIKLLCIAERCFFLLVDAVLVRDELHSASFFLSPCLGSSSQSDINW